MAAADSARAVLYALGANFAIAVAKYVAAAITGSGSMIAEAVHSTADCGNQLLLLLGLKRSRRAPTREYPLGFGKETSIVMEAGSMAGAMREVNNDPAVEKVLELLTLHMGPDVMVAVKARMREHPGQAALIDAINRAEASFKARFPRAHWIFFEPDVRD